MLEFYQSYRKCDLPPSLANELYDSSGEKLSLIHGLNKVNIFVGANNSGKSLIIREILKSKVTKYIGDVEWTCIKERINSFFEEVRSGLFAAAPHYGLYRFGDTESGRYFDLNVFEEIRDRLVTYLPNYDLRSVINEISTLFSRDFKVKTNIGYYIEHNGSQRETFSSTHRLENLQRIFDELKSLKEKCFEVIKLLETFLVDDNYKSKIYIPSIRTLRGFAAKANIEDETKREYQFDKDVEIYNGQSFPAYVFDLKNAPFQDRQVLSKYESFLSKELFESKSVDLTFSRATSELLIKIGQEAERPIHLLGDGIQMLIILTFPFFKDKGGVVVIEEPELFIHPGYQKRLLSFFINNPITRNFQIFIASHSNHILDSVNISEKVSIFSINKKFKENDESEEKIPDFILDNIAVGNENLLHLLGVTTTSVYLSNCVIWVEGITDKLYLSKYISEYLKLKNITEKYKKCMEYKEGINYSFALTGGDSIIHWDFGDDGEYSQIKDKIIVRKFCSKSMVITDSDFNKNVERKHKLNDLLGDRFIELSVPEIENLLDPLIIDSVLKEYPTVSKKNLNAALKLIEKDDLKEYKIGYLIDNKILDAVSKSKKFSAPNGGLKPTDKYDFCAKAIKYISQDNLSDDARMLVERILDFIIAKNHFE